MGSEAKVEETEGSFGQNGTDWQAALERVVQLGARIKARRRGQPLTPPADVIRDARRQRDAELTQPD